MLSFSKVQEYLEQNIYKLLLLLLAADVSFILVDISFSEDHRSIYSMSKDLGYAEVFQYIKETWIAILLVLLLLARKQLVFLFWAILYGYFLLDDSLQIHEILGRAVVRNFGIESIVGIRAESFGELIVSGVIGSLLLVLILVSYLRSHADSKAISRILLILTLGLVFFGVFVDTVHSALPGSIQIWARVEDGGEMILMSLVLVYLFGLRFGVTRDSARNRRVFSR